MKTTTLTGLSQIVKQLPTATAFVDTDFKLVHASAKWISNFRFDSSKIIGENIFDLFDNFDKDWHKTLLNYFNNTSDEALQTKKTNFGKEQWFEWSSTPWYDNNENIIGVIIQTEDITSAVSIEKKLEVVENLLQEQSEISKVGTWEYDLNSQRITWSNMTKKIHEVSQDYQPNIDTAIGFYKHGHDRNTIAMLVHNAIEKGETWNRRLRIITSKGNEKWVTSAGKPIYFNGKATHLMGTFQDVTKEVEAEIKTQENERLLRTLIDNMPLNVFIKDTDSQKILVNKAECDYLGITDSSEILGKSDHELYNQNIADISRDEDIHVMKTQKPMLSKRTVSIKKDGTITSFLTSKIPFIGINGESKGVIGISMDISEVIQKEDQLRELINVTAIQNKKLINFAHIVSHNLRSHTANFSMLLDFLINEKDDGEKQRIMEMLSNASDNLMDTLENLNEVVDISTNVNLEKKLLNFNEYITKVEQNLAAFLHKNHVKITNHIPDDFNIKAVPAFMESIILNLVTNAVKYKHPDRDPSIVLSVKDQGDTSIFSIQDNGLGINLDKYGKKLFGMYKTFHNNKDARGIGLYIVKNQIESMGGNISVKSEVEKGSTFNVYFNDKN